MLANPGTKKRTRDDDEDLVTQEYHLDKRSRQTTGDNQKWYHGHHDSVLSTPIFTREQPKYDSDDQDSSSMVSEPGSPQDVSMSSGDEMEDATLSHSPEDSIVHPRASTWGPRLQTNRVPTPIVSMRPSVRPVQRTGPRQHIRQRHPQENLSCDHLEVPSPIDEDEVPTPPSAAEAAGSQLSMLTVSDIEMDENDLIPTISIEPARPSSRGSLREASRMLETVPEFEPMDSTTGIVVRKQRQRSGALSSGNSPVRAGPSQFPDNKVRGLSVGYRADCEKCRMRVPGHMNHFI